MEFIASIFGIIVFFLLVYIAVIFIVALKTSKKESYHDDSIPDHIHTVDNPIRPVYRNSSDNIKVVNNPETYSVIHKHGSFKDNMNYNLYSAKAVFSETNRKRTKKIEAFNEKEVVDMMHDQGFIGDVEVTQIPFPEATEEQVNTCRVHHHPLYSDMCKYDFSYYISRMTDADSIPNPDLVAFATNRKIKFSYYIGKKALYNRIYEYLDTEDKIAFLQERRML